MVDDPCHEWQYSENGSCVAVLIRIADTKQEVRHLWQVKPLCQSLSQQNGKESKAKESPASETKCSIMFGFLDWVSAHMCMCKDTVVL